MICGRIVLQIFAISGFIQKWSYKLVEETNVSIPDLVEAISYGPDIIEQDGHTRNDAPFSNLFVYNSILDPRK